MPDDPIARLLEPRERPAQPRPEFREELWDRLLVESRRRPAAAWPGGGGPPWRRPDVRRFLAIAAALLLGVAAVVVVLPLQGRGPVRTIGDIPEFGPMPALRATIERRIPRAIIQGFVDAAAEERGGDPVTVDADQVIRLRLTADGGRWRIDWLSDSLLEGPDPALAQVLEGVSSDRSPGSYWVGGGEQAGRYSAASNTFVAEPVLEGWHPLDLLSWDATAAAAAFWEEACASGTVVGTETVAGRTAHHLRCGPWEAWIDARLGLILQVRLHDPEQLGVPVPGAIPIFSEETVSVTALEVGPEIEQEALEFRPPPEAVEAGAAEQPQEATRLALGDPVPSPRIETLDGGPFRLRELRGRPTVVYVWASWCSPCLGPFEEPDLLFELDQTARRFTDLTVVMIAAGDDPTEVRRITEGYDSAVVALDEEGVFPRRVGSEGIPVLVLVDPDSSLAGAYLAGLHPDQLRRILGAFIEGRPLPDIGGNVISQVP